MIRFSQPAVVSGEFVAAVIYCAVEKLKNFKDYPVSVRGYRDQRVERATAVRYLVPLANKEHKALDELLTRLRKLKYEKYEFYQGKHGYVDGYFLGTTQPLIMTSNQGDRWKIGRYTVEVPVQGVLYRRLDTFKMHPIVPDVGPTAMVAASVNRNVPAPRAHSIAAHDAGLPSRRLSQRRASGSIAPAGGTPS